MLLEPIHRLCHLLVFHLTVHKPNPGSCPESRPLFLTSFDGNRNAREWHRKDYTL